MKACKRILSVITTIALVASFLAYVPNMVFAAAIPVAISVDSYENGTANFHWEPVSGTQSVRITYHTPDGAEEVIINSSADNIFSLSSLEKDTVYDINLQVFDGVDASGNMIGTGLLYYLPGITFYSTRIEQTAVSLEGGGYETGIDPRLNLRWVMPKVYIDSVASYVYANENSALIEMQDELNSIYSFREVDSLNFRINISTDASRLNGGSTQASLLIDQGAGGYTAKVSGNNSVTADVNPIDGSGFMDFELVGRKDENSGPAETDASDQLQDWDILPGSVYYMNIRPMFRNSSGTSVNVMTVGVPSDQNGSKLSGTSEYTYTPLRFQLTKDSANNLYVKIFKINQGSLNLPRLFYEVQASDDSSIPGDWTIKKTIDDTYFVGEYAVTVLSGINPNNEVAYKIVVKSDSAGDRIESPYMPYTLTADTSKPPLPTGLMVVERELVIRTVGDEVQKSTDITISWEKPANWEDIKNNRDENEDIVFHFLINTAQADSAGMPYPALEAEGEVYGHFPVVYRLVKHISALSPNIVETGTRLEYTISGFDLFNGEFYTGEVTAEGEPITDEVNIPNDEVDADGNKYPDFLLPNKVYYLKMYTTKAEHTGSTDSRFTSDISLISSFTTLSGIVNEVPLPGNFRLNENVIEDGGNQIELQFEKASIDWNSYGVSTGQVYYDLYMSTRTDTSSFVMVGTTEDETFGGVDWSNDPQNTFVSVTIRDFENNDRAISAFGTRLRPNTPYYFFAKTRIVTANEERQSAATSIIPVTTLKGDVTPPGQDTRIPLSPYDFAVAEDDNGNPLLSGSSVTFGWLNREDGVKYSLICTSAKIGPDAEPADYEDDPVYQSFIAEFGDRDSDGDDTQFILDPEQDIASGYFELDNATDPPGLNLTLSSWIFPNRLYYFSLRAELNDKQSVWVSIPVTTLLIDKPFSLETVEDYQLGFFWSDSDVSLVAEDFSVYMKGPKDSTYKLLTRSQYTVTRDGTTYYARALNLESNSYYSFRVYKGGSSQVLVSEKSGLKTRDGFHEIEVKWRGEKGYSYQIGAKSETESDYAVLSSLNLERYLNSDGSTNPYYIEKDPQTLGTAVNCYYARIKTVPGLAQDGSTANLKLQSNTKYYVKVRSVKIEPTDTTLISYSKYEGPVNTRTEFNQEDYDDIDQDNKKEAVFTDKVSAIEEGYYWRVSTESSDAVKILLKSDRIINALRNSSSPNFAVNISTVLPEIDRNIIYMPIDVVRVLNTEDKSLTLMVPGAEFTVRPGTIDLQNNDDIRQLQESSTVKDIFLEITIIRSSADSRDYPSNAKAASRENEFRLELMGSTKTYIELKDMIKDYLYNEESGLVSQKLSILLTHDFGSGSGDSSLMDEYSASLIRQMERELSSYIYSKINSIRVGSSTKRQIKAFGVPMLVKLYQSGSGGLVQPYAYYDNNQQWSVVSSVANQAFNTTSFNVNGTGCYVILIAQVVPADVSGDRPGGSYIIRFMSKYDLSSVFSGVNDAFYPEEKVSGKEMVLLYEVVMNRSAESPGADLRQKAQILGIDRIIGLNSLMRDVNRQKTAALFTRIYCGKTGVNEGSLKSTRTIYLQDDARVDSQYYNPVIIAVDMNVMELDAQGNFLPDKSMSRAEVITALVKLLEITGEMQKDN